MATTASRLSLTVRAIALADASAIAELSAQLGYDANVAEMRKRIAALLPLPDDHIALVACLDSEVVGWIEAEVAHHLQSSAHTLITGLVVKDGVRSHGIGRRLCSEVEEWSRRNGISIVRVTSRSTRERAHRFYLRDGFAQTKISHVFEKVLS
jgi:GNAT superfamily N-acetyltransferase